MGGHVSLPSHHMAGEGLSQISHALRFLGLAYPPLHCPDELKVPTFQNSAAGKQAGQLSQQQEVVWARGEGIFSIAPTTIAQMREVVPAILLSCPQGWLTRVSLYSVAVE